ncbi:MAG: radical SAM protein [Desulfobacterales bacterium]
MTSAPHILLVNPWIHDFAAYDFWAKPLGLLGLAALLRHHGCMVSYIDCLNRWHPRAPATDPRQRCGRGPYLKTPLPKPAALADVPRRFSRYGIKPEWLRQDLHALPRPDLILVTSMMTYWYTGVHETIGQLREIFADVPLFLGGIYATLCPEHARRTTGADRVAGGAAEPVLLDLVAEVTGYRPAALFDPQDLDTYPHPAHDLQHLIGYIPLLTARGCPFACPYCAAKKLNPRRMARCPELVVDEICRWHRDFGVRDFVFYDDALLMQAEHHAAPIFEGVIRRGGAKLRFHTPNALHIRWITPAIAHLMKRAGFETVRLGLETAAAAHRPAGDRKVTAGEFERAAGCLKKAGFQKRQVGAYLLAGLPGQSVEEIAASIQIVRENGVTPILAHYSPIPHTDLWPAAVAASRYDLAADPIFTNNAVLPCRKEPFSWATITRLKKLAAA